MPDTQKDKKKKARGGVEGFVCVGVLLCLCLGVSMCVCIGVSVSMCLCVYVSSRAEHYIRVA